MRKAFYLTGLAALFCMLILLSGCARNPVEGVSEDGRLFAVVDLDSRHVSNNYLRIETEVEGYEPFLITVFDFRYKERLNVSQFEVLDALDWPVIQGKPIDLTGEVVDGGHEGSGEVNPGVVIKGGNEVRVRVASYLYNEVRTNFKLDGNTLLRIYVLNPNASGAKRLHIERTTQGSSF